MIKEKKVTPSAKKLPALYYNNDPQEFCAYRQQL
jgi:hypothetical protein